LSLLKYGQLLHEIALRLFAHKLRQLGNAFANRLADYLILNFAAEFEKNFDCCLQFLG